jgi:hypothetical protein
MQVIWYILADLCGLGFFTSLLTESLTLETEELGRQHFDADMV